MKSYLQDQETEDLNWKDTQFSFPNMIRIRTIADGSCLFHAIANAFFPPYQTGYINGQSISKYDIVYSFRNDLAEALNAPNSEQVDKTNYQVLGKGNIQELGAALDEYSLVHLQAVLRNHRIEVGNEYNELISNILNKDIYILDGNKCDVYPTGTDDEIIYKNRPSIVLHYLPGHYELVGLRTSHGITTLFDPHSAFIRAIRARLVHVK